MAAEQTKPVLQENKTSIKSQLVNFAWHLKKLGRAEQTIKTYTNYLKNIGKHGDISDPESVKGVIATHYKDRGTKRLACCIYEAYLKFSGREWTKPDYRPEHKIPFIPTEKELQLAINSGQKESMVFAKFLYETGARCNEAERLEWTDLHKDKNKVTIKASKNGDSRIIDITDELMNLLFSLPKNQETVFAKKQKSNRNSSFINRTKRLAKIHNNPRLAKIHLHTLRHCKALREYHKTRDILHVMGVLGHRNLDTTYRYVRLYHQIYKPQQPDQFITKIASTKEQRIELINDGWNLVEKDEEDWYFRKPK